MPAPASVSYTHLDSNVGFEVLFSSQRFSSWLIKVVWLLLDKDETAHLASKPAGVIFCVEASGKKLPLKCGCCQLECSAIVLLSAIGVKLKVSIPRKFSLNSNVRFLLARTFNLSKLAWMPLPSVLRLVPCSNSNSWPFNVSSGLPLIPRVSLIPRLT